MVTRKPAFEKQEHGLRFTFKLITRHNFTKPPAAVLNAKWLPPRAWSTSARAGFRAGLSRGAAACNEAIAKQPVPQQAGRLYSCPGDRKRQEVLAGMIDAVTKPKTKVKTKTERPRLHKVILINDDYTPREFVVTVLKAEFRMTEDQAHKVMITAHRLGVCVVAVFTKDVAETKATRATDAGRAKGYPLLFTTEPEE
jgi:ATP-dependent Clp protease adaptor protein ClpS